MITSFLGPGCRKSVTLGENATAAAAGTKAEIAPVAGIAQIAGRGVMAAPRPRIDETPASAGMVLSVAQTGSLL